MSIQGPKSQAPLSWSVSQLLTEIGGPMFIAEILCGLLIDLLFLNSLLDSPEALAYSSLT